MRNREIVTQSGAMTVKSVTVFIVENRDGSRWYVAEGGTVVNLTYDSIDESTNIEELVDNDCFSVSDCIESLEGLEIVCEGM